MNNLYILGNKSYQVSGMMYSTYLFSCYEYTELFKKILFVRKYQKVIEVHLHISPIQFFMDY